MLIDILIKYIHLNPIRVKVVRTDEEYPWSSHRFYSGGLVMEDAIIDIGAVLGMFSEDGRKARRLYLTVAKRTQANRPSRLRKAVVLKI